MKRSENGTTLFQETQSSTSRSVIRFCWAVLLLLVVLIPVAGHAQMGHKLKPAGSEPTPTPAVAAVLSAFDKYEVVGMPAAHGMKDLDDFIEYDDDEDGGGMMDEAEREEKRKEKRRAEKARRKAMGARPELAGIDAK